MWLLILLILIAFISGCNSAGYKDPYVAAVERYISELELAASGAAPELKPPPEPSYLNCPTEPEPLPGYGHGGSEFSYLNSSESVSPRRLSTRSTAQCEQINKARREAYEAALDKYRSVVSAASGGL
jgi:hypothetical protein